LASRSTWITPDLRRIAALGLDNVELAGPLPFRRSRRARGAHLMVSRLAARGAEPGGDRSLASGTPVVGLANETIDELVTNRSAPACRRNGKRTSPIGCRPSVGCHRSAYERLCATPGAG
jgi:hypothetical protein